MSVMKYDADQAMKAVLDHWPNSDAHGICYQVIPSARRLIIYLVIWKSSIALTDLVIAKEYEKKNP